MKISKLLIIAILVLGFAFRLYKIDNPVADWHSWRQADTSSVTRNFVKYGFTPLTPRFDDLSNIASGIDNPKGYRFVEFPIYNSISYILITLDVQNVFSVEIWQRIVSVVASLGSIYLVYLLCKKYANQQVALIAALIMAALPFSVYYSRVILPEPTLIFFTLLALYLFSVFVDTKKRNAFSFSVLALSIIATSCALLAKPIAVFFLIPAIYLWVDKKGFSRKSVILPILFFALSAVPLVLWREWMQQYPEGIPAWKWLLNSDNIRFKGAFFYWLFAERIGKLMLGYVGMAFIIPGLLFTKKCKKPWFFCWWGAGSLLYLVIFATGNIKHDYYQAILIPVISIFAANGVHFFLIYAGKLFNRWATYALVSAVFLFTLSFSWYHIRGYYWVNNSTIVEAGKKADELLPENAKVIAPYGGDTAFLYQTNRQGWPSGLEIEDKIKKGATHYVSVTPKDAEVLWLKQLYPTLFETDEFAILSLQ